MGALRFQQNRLCGLERLAAPRGVGPRNPPSGLARLARKRRVPRDPPQFYLTSPAPCPYLPGKDERKVFTHLVGRRASHLNDALTHSGFRRSQTIAYRPACENCKACVSVRILCEEFQPGRTQKRVLARNRDVYSTIGPARADSEQFNLFRAYLDSRHNDGGMADMAMLDYAMMVEDSHVDSRLATYRLREIRRRPGQDGGVLPHRRAR